MQAEERQGIERFVAHNGVDDVMLDIMLPRNDNTVAGDEQVGHEHNAVGLPVTIIVAKDKVEDVIKALHLVPRFSGFDRLKWCQWRDVSQG